MIGPPQPQPGPGEIRDAAGAFEGAVVGAAEAMSDHGGWYIMNADQPVTPPERTAVDKQQVNPWTWQDQLGFSQAWRVDGAQTVVFLSGQAPISAQGDLVGKGDFEAQTRQVFENLRSVLEQAGAGFDSIVKLTVYVTDTSRLRDYARVKAEYIPGPQPASTAIGVASLALEGMMIEVEATVVL